MNDTITHRPVVFTKGRVLLEHGFQEDIVVRVDDRRITSIAGDADVALDDAEIIDLGGDLLAPGFIDVQVNGGGGVLFNHAPSVEGIAAIGAAHRRFGTTGFLPTLITDRVETMRIAIDAVDAAIGQGVPGVLGIHLEGPYLAADRRGVHDAALFVQPDLADVAMLSSLASGVTLLTLAPEQVERGVLRELVQAGVIVAAGHTAGSYEDTRRALDDGVRGFTHLYNAMTPLQGRAPGVVGAALEDRESWCCIIVDGAHVHDASIRVAHAAKPHGKMVLVTDAMPVVGAPEPTFVLNGEIIRCENGSCVAASGSLAGSCLDMASAVRNTHALGIALDESLRMAATYPAQFLGIEARRGSISVGKAADLVRLSGVEQGLTVRGTWIEGR